MALIPLQQADPLRYKAWVESSQQPGATLNQTNAAAAAEGASAGLAAQNTTNAQLEEKIKERSIKQQNALDDTAALFESKKDPNTGRVPPSIFNKQKDATSGLIDSKTFDGQFDSYTNPDSIDYKTATSIANKQNYEETKRQLEQVIKSYNAIPDIQKGPTKSFLEQGIPVVGEALGQYLAPQALGYEKTKEGLISSVRSAAASGAQVRPSQALIGDWANLLPSTRNSDAVNAKNIQTLNGLLTSKFNTNVGIDPKLLPSDQQKTLHTVDGLVQNAGSNAKDILNGILNIPAQAVENQNKYGSMGQSILSGQGPGRQLLLGSTAPIVPAAQEANQALGEPLKGGDVLSRILQRAYDKPVTTGMDIATVLPFLRGAGNGGFPVNPEVSRNPELAITQNSPQISPSQTTSLTPVSPEVKIPNAIQKILNPQSLRDAGSAIREAAVTTADKAGKTISGDNIVSAVKNWGENAAKANPGEEAKIQAIIDSTTNQYKGQAVKPSDAVKIYNEVDSGFNRQGITKENIRASADQALRSTLRAEIEKVAPGFDNGTKLIGQGFQQDRSTTGKIMKDLPKKAVGVGLNVAGLGVIGKILGL